jgi:hypothetical protein
MDHSGAYKRCPACDSLKEIIDFPRNRSNKDGLATYCKPCHNRIMRSNKDRLHGSQRNYLLKHRYSIDAVTVEWLKLQQNSLCALCSSGQPEHVDHDHATGSVRGILCFNCNRGIAKFAEDTEVMKQAISYLGIAKSAP